VAAIVRELRESPKTVEEEPQRAEFYLLSRWRSVKPTAAIETSLR
jgi:hypothetical protein